MEWPRNRQTLTCMKIRRIIQRFRAQDQSLGKFFKVQCSLRIWERKQISTKYIRGRIKIS